MGKHNYNDTRLLIIAKTYPELSSKYGETVCTAAVTEDGAPIRIYPIQFRYLSGTQKFDRYQWIKAPIAKNLQDNRPESYRISAEEIVRGEVIPSTKDEWGKRAELVFKNETWQFPSVEALIDAQQRYGNSLGVVVPQKITKIFTKPRPEEDTLSFEEKFKRLKEQASIDRQQLDLFRTSLPAEMKELEFLQQRITVEWTCAGPDCMGHNMQILDWEICELFRREGAEKACDKVEEILDLDKYATKFFLGNFHMYPASFAIIGLWYPKRSNRLF